MDATLGLLIFGELLLILAIVYGILHEDVLIRFENAVFAAARASFRRRRIKKERENRQKYYERIAYTPVKPSSRADRSTKEAA